MNVLLREEFVKLHDQPLLEKLRKSFEVRYPHLDFPPVPDKGSLDLNEVKKSTYFFS
jgi:DNA-directed RNA polymerase